MACKFCEDLEKLAKVRSVIGAQTPLNYCPVCGEYLTIMDFIREAKSFVDTLWRESVKQQETVEIDGETLVVERIPSPKPEPKPKAVAKPLDMAFDLDKISIDKEVKLLEDHQAACVQQVCEFFGATNADDLRERLEQYKRGRDN